MEEKSAASKIGDLIVGIFGWMVIAFLVLLGIAWLQGGGENDASLTEGQLYATEQAEYDNYYDRLNEQDQYSRDYDEWRDADFAEWQYEQYQESNEGDESVSDGAIHPSSVDCDTFSTQREAQEFFEDNGGVSHDPYYLDGDGDGVACELNQ